MGSTPPRSIRTSCKLVKAAAMVERNGTDYAVYLCRVFRRGPGVLQAASTIGRSRKCSTATRWAAGPSWQIPAGASRTRSQRYRAGYKLPLDADASVRGSKTWAS